MTCHSATRKAGGLSLAAFRPSGVHAEIGEKVIRKLRAGLMPPAGALRPDANSLGGFVASLEKAIDAEPVSNPPPPVFARLNAAEYARAIEDLLGVAFDVSAFAPPDTMSGAFDNISDSQTFSPTLLTGYLRGADALSRKALSTPASRRKVLVCAPASGALELACATRILKPFAARAYRGDVATEDFQAIVDVYRDGRGRGTFEDGIRLALQAILASPRFLFRLEVDSKAALASRLSFFLWSRGPDAKLLQNPSDRNQVRRMLADPRAEALSTRFAMQWLRLQELGRATPDPALFPEWSPALAQSMLRETQLNFSEIARKDLPVLRLLTADESFVDSLLAKHYGIAGVSGAGFRRVSLPPYRRGLLGQASVLTATSVSDRTSPVLRGKWILDVLLGTPPPPPPPNVPSLDESVKPARNGKPRSTSQRIELHRSRPACAGCHSAIDPLGLPLENFGPTGAWREIDNGVAVDANGKLSDGKRLSGPIDLGTVLLAKQDLFLLSFTEHLFTYALGRPLTYRDMPAVRKIIALARAENYRFSAFVRGIVESAAFRAPPGKG